MLDINKKRILLLLFFGVFGILLLHAAQPSDQPSAKKLKSAAGAETQVAEGSVAASVTVTDFSCFYNEFDSDESDSDDDDECAAISAKRVKTDHTPTDSVDDPAADLYAPAVIKKEAAVSIVNRQGETVTVWVERSFSYESTVGYSRLKKWMRSGCITCERACEFPQDLTYGKIMLFAFDSNTNQKGEKIGYIFFSGKSYYGSIDNLYVLDNFRGQGYGYWLASTACAVLETHLRKNFSQMIRYFRRHTNDLISRGMIPSIYLKDCSQNVRGERTGVYPRLGFRPLNKDSDFIPKYWQRLDMIRVLEGPWGTNEGLS